MKGHPRLLTKNNVLDYVIYISHTFKITRRALRFLDFGDLLRDIIKNHQNNNGVHYGNPPKAKSNQPKGYNPVNDITIR